MCSEAPQIFLCESEHATSDLAKKLAEVAGGGCFISLEGDLGAGKTFFARAFARALGITENITSPTFVIQKTYQVRSKPGVSTLAHYDLYRITAYAELLGLGFEDHDPSTIVLTEWGDLYIKEFPVKPVRIRLEPQSSDSRLISVTGLSKHLIMP